MQKRHARATLPPDAGERLKRIRLVCFDVDGVLTDGHLYFLPNGEWSQRFYVRDGYGIKLLQQAGVEIAILSSGDVRSGRARAESLGIKHVHFGVTDKASKFAELAKNVGVSAPEAAFMGDELVDIPLLQQVGFGATVPDAVEEVRAAAHYVTQRRGGEGAVREICDLIRNHR